MLIPTFHDATLLVGAGAETPLERFVFDFEPDGETEERFFRERLQGLIDHLTNPGPCTWTEKDEGEYWSSPCNDFSFVDGGGPKAHNFKFCPYCGKPIQERTSEDQLVPEGEE